MFTVARGFEAISCANFVVSDTREVAGTTRFTKLIACAWSAEIVSPVRSISIACLRDTLRDSATIGVEQNSPMFTPGVANRAADDATARSQLATSWQPAAVAMPWTCAITGLGWRTTVCISREHCANSA